MSPPTYPHWLRSLDADKCLGNVETNLAPRGLTGNVCVRRLKWGSAEDLSSFNPPYDVVVAGDCLYEEACITPLLETMWELAGPDTDVSPFVFVPWIGRWRQQYITIHSASGVPNSDRGPSFKLFCAICYFRKKNLWNRERKLLNRKYHDSEINVIIIIAIYTVFMEQGCLLR